MALRTVQRLVCAECGAWSEGEARGWRAFRSDELGEEEPPTLIFFCPACAERDFGDRGRQHPTPEIDGCRVPLDAPASPTNRARLMKCVPLADCTAGGEA